MLCLSRYRGERIVLETSDGPVWLTVLDVQTGGSSRIRLGIEAPTSVGVFREEIYAERSRAAVSAEQAALNQDTGEVVG